MKSTTVKGTKTYIYNSVTLTFEEGCDHRLLDCIEPDTKDYLPMHECVLCSFTEPCFPRKLYLSYGKFSASCLCGRNYDVIGEYITPRITKHPDGRIDWTMKIKQEFITNSSSVSYILTLYTKKPYTLEEFKANMNAFLEKMKGQYTDLRAWDASDVKEIGPNAFEISQWVAMHNYVSDIPKWMQHFIIADYIGDVSGEFHELGVTHARFRMEHDY